MLCCCEYSVLSTRPRSAHLCVGIQGGWLEQLKGGEATLRLDESKLMGLLGEAGRRGWLTERDRLLSTGRTCVLACLRTHLPAFQGGT